MQPHLGALITNKREEVKEIDARLSEANRIAGNIEGKTTLKDHEIKIILYKEVFLFIDTGSPNLKTDRI